MAGILDRLTSKALDQLVGSGVALDDDGRLCFPDGLDSKRIHRFIELVMARGFDNPKAALRALLDRVGVARATGRVLDDILGDHVELDWRAIGKRPLALGASVPRLLEIPTRFRHFLVAELALADPMGRTLEDAVVSTRIRAAERIGCAPCWDAILAQPDAVAALAHEWRSCA